MKSSFKNCTEIHCIYSSYLWPLLTFVCSETCKCDKYTKKSNNTKKSGRGQIHFHILCGCVLLQQHFLSWDSKRVSLTWLKLLWFKECLYLTVPSENKPTKNFFGVSISTPNHLSTCQKWSLFKKRAHSVNTSNKNRIFEKHSVPRDSRLNLSLLSIALWNCI